MQIEPVTLEGRHVRLEPLSAAAHGAGLAVAIGDGELWRLPVTWVPHPDDLPGFFADAAGALAAGRELAFATIERAGGRVVGSTRFRCIDRQHRRAEIGFTFIARGWQRTAVNTEAKYLMLRHAFDTWGCHRIELLTDVRNAASRRAIERIGATQEGILRDHMVMRDGFVRSSVVFSIVATEWPAVSRRLTTLLETP